MKEIYIVIMQRRANNHSYPIGVYNDFNYALFIGKIHGKFIRADKYYPKIVKYTVPNYQTQLYICQQTSSDEKSNYNFYIKPQNSSEEFAIENYLNFASDYSFIQLIHEGMSLHSFYNEQDLIIIKDIYEKYLRNL